MENELLIENYIQLLSVEGFINEGANVFFKNIGAQNQEVFYNYQDQKFIKQIKVDYIEGRSVNLIAEVHYNTLRNYENAENLKIYIDYLIESRKNVFSKEIICMDTMENLKSELEYEGYQTEDVYYDFPHYTGQSFSFFDFPSKQKFEFKHIGGTDFITIIRTSDEILKKIILKSDDLKELTDENILSYIKQKLDD